MAKKANSLAMYFGLDKDSRILMARRINLGSWEAVRKDIDKTVDGNSGDTGVAKGAKEAVREKKARIRELEPYRSLVHCAKIECLGWAVRSVYSTFLDLSKKGSDSVKIPKEVVDHQEKNPELNLPAADRGVGAGTGPLVTLRVDNL